MRRHWRLWKMALRAVLWRATAEPPAIGLRGLAGWTVAAILFLLVIQVPTPKRSSANTASGFSSAPSSCRSRAAALALPAASRVSGARRDAADRLCGRCW